MIHFIQYHWWLWLIVWIVGWVSVFKYRIHKAKQNKNPNFGIIFFLAGTGTFCLVLSVISCLLCISHR